MKIEKIKINGYGTLKEKEINLQNHINLIYGKNEKGKSTLLSYIKNSFYGISKNKNGKEISDYDKYLPWNGETFSGKIKYSLEDGSHYEVYRDFLKRNVSIFNENLEDISHQFKIDKKGGSLFLYEQTGVNEQTYLSTIMSMQQQVVLDFNSQNTLVQKVANLGETGDETISFQKAIERLNKRQLEEVGTSRTQDRPINLLQNRNKKILVALKTENEYTQKKKKLEMEKEQIQEELKIEKQKNNELSKLNMLTKQAEIDIEKNNIKNKIKNENEQKYKKLIQEKDEYIKNNFEKNENKYNLKNKKEIKSKLTKKIKRNYFIFSIIFILLILINIINFILIPNKIINIVHLNTNEIINFIILLLLPIQAFLFVFYYILNNKKINKLEKEILIEKQKEEKIEQQIMMYDNQINSLKKEIEKKQQEIDIENEKIFYKEKELAQKSSYKIQKEFIEQELKNSAQKIMNYQIQLNSIQYEENIISQKLENSISLKEEQEQIKEQLNILEEKDNCFQITKKLIEKAYEKMKNNVTPKFTQNLSNIICKISNGKYQKVSIHETKGLIVELDDGRYIPASLLSTGTIDQFYLALRLSMLDEIAKEKMPIILDESFAYFDDERLENILLYLTEQAKKHQIILFTCTKREKQILDNKQIAYQWIEL